MQPGLFGVDSRTGVTPFDRDGGSVALPGQSDPPILVGGLQRVAQEVEEEPVELNGIRTQSKVRRDVLRLWHVGLTNAGSVRR